MDALSFGFVSFIATAALAPVAVLVGRWTYKCARSSSTRYKIIQKNEMQCLGAYIGLLSILAVLGLACYFVPFVGWPVVIIYFIIRIGSLSLEKNGLFNDCCVCGYSMEGLLRHPTHVARCPECGTMVKPNSDAMRRQAAAARRSVGRT